MKIAILHDTVSAADAPDAQDVMAQAAAVARALRSLGHRVSHMACTLNLAAMQATLRRARSTACLTWWNPSMARAPHSPAAFLPGRHGDALYRRPGRDPCC